MWILPIFFVGNHVKKKARVSSAEPAFAEIEPFVAALPHIKLLAAIHKAWDSSPELRSALDAATRDD